MVLILTTVATAFVSARMTKIHDVIHVPPAPPTSDEVVRSHFGPLSPLSCVACLLIRDVTPCTYTGFRLYM